VNAESKPPVVLLSTADWHWPYWTNKQHTAVHLAKRGYRVLYVETVGVRRAALNAIDFRRIISRAWRGLRGVQQVRERLFVLSPLTIPLGQRHAAVTRFNDWQLRRAITGWLAGQGGGRPIIWTYHPFMLDAVEALEPAALVYHCVDDLGAIPGVDRLRFEREEARLLARADHVFAASRPLWQRCMAIAPQATHYFANVADLDHFAAARRAGEIPADLERIPHPRLAYVGVISDFKVDLPLLEQVALRRPDWQIVFIGDEREGQASPVVARLAKLPNVHFVGWRPYAALPAYLRGIDVALLPLLANDYTGSMFPMKYFEYLSAGRTVVATPLPALAEFAAHHRTGAGVDDFVTAIAESLSAPASAIIALDDPLLRQHTWEARLDAMLAVVDRQRAGASS
jgi:glycosyltransferase involved in cell wall biosynthesis